MLENEGENEEETRLRTAVDAIYQPASAFLVMLETDESPRCGAVLKLAMLATNPRDAGEGGWSLERRDEGCCKLAMVD
ncbi:unnamed protein product [Linum trigynum]|uniref:Uncharacterized protein n=1 Tax=Linum trigynum TaxID=586398 RepID=A0AAV2DD68_9ROSI